VRSAFVRALALEALGDPARSAIWGQAGEQARRWHAIDQIERTLKRAAARSQELQGALGRVKRRSEVQRLHLQRTSRTRPRVAVNGADCSCARLPSDLNLTHGTSRRVHSNLRIAGGKRRLLHGTPDPLSLTISAASTESAQMP
jgi:hypothetical protein